MSKLMWITGASSGIGRELALRAAREGWRVVASARGQTALSALEREGSGRITACPLDVTDLSACRQAVEELENENGPIDLAVLNAGTHKPTPVEDFNAEVVAILVDVNLMGIVNVLDPLLPRMIERRHGHLALMASVAAYRGLPTASGYCASKAAVIALAEAINAELGQYDVKVQVVCPGFVRTPLTDRNEFPMPFLMEVEDAVDRIWEGLHGRSFEIAFPRRFVWQLKTMQSLPDSLYFPLIRKATNK